MAKPVTEFPYDLGRRGLPTPSGETAQPDQPQRGRMRRWRRLLKFGIAISLCVLLSTVAYRWGDYRWHRIVCHEAQVTGPISYLGPRIEGRIATILVEEGQRVSAGDVVATLEDGHLKARVGQARAELARATRELETERLAILKDRRRLEVLVSRAEVEVRVAEAELTAAESESQRLERERQRIAAVIARGAATNHSLDEVTGSKDVAAATTAAAAARLEAAKLAVELALADVDMLESRKAGLKIIEEQVQVSRSMIESAEADLEAATIHAPESGWVGQLLLQPGASIKIGDPILSLWTREEYWVEAWVEEKHLGNMNLDHAVEITFAAYPDRVFFGQIESVGVLSRSKSGHPEDRDAAETRLADGATAKVRVRLTSPTPKLFPGLSATIAIRKSRTGARFVGYLRNLLGVSRHC